MNLINHHCQRLKGYLTLTVYKHTVHIALIIYILFYRKRHRSSQAYDANIYVSVNDNYFFLSLATILSLDFFVKNLNYAILNGGKLSKFHRFIFKYLGIQVTYPEEKEERSVRLLLMNKPSLEAYYNYGWSGRKFCIPLLTNPFNKTVILDLDILFFNYPKELVLWLTNESNCCNYYIKDYENFSVLSSIEVESIQKRKPWLSHVNSGFLLLNHKDLLDKTPLKQLDDIIRQTIIIVKDRLTFDHMANSDIVYIYPLIEQTLFWIMFENSYAKPLNSKNYVMFPRHKVHKEKITQPTMIHFTGEADKRSMYKYLFFSLFSFCVNFLRSYPKSTKLWINYSNEYCPRCRHFTQ